MFSAGLLWSEVSCGLDRWGPGRPLSSKYPQQRKLLYLSDSNEQRVQSRGQAGCRRRDSFFHDQSAIGVKNHFARVYRVIECMVPLAVSRECVQHLTCTAVQGGAVGGYGSVAITAAAKGEFDPALSPSPVQGRCPQGFLTTVDHDVP